jgi:hypothetical protein
VENPPHQALRILNEKYMKKTEYSKTWKVIDTEYLIKRPWLTARRDHLLLPDGREIPEYYPGTMTNMTHCFLATGVEKTSEQHLDATEELEVHLLTREEVCSVLHNNEMMQSLMVAPLLKYLSPELK